MEEQFYVTAMQVMTVNIVWLKSSWKENNKPIISLIMFPKPLNFSHILPVLFCFRANFFDCARQQKEEYPP
jgi:hypothetical protein